MNQDDIQRAVAQSLEVKRRFFDANAGIVLRVGQSIAERLRAGGKALIFGNGGSAADAQHFAAELVGRFQRDRAALPAVALTTDTSILTAIANDFGFEQVFRRQVEALGRAGDVAFGITTSGQSKNVVEALRLAKERGLMTVGLTGRGGGAVRGIVDHLIDVPSQETQRIQEVHAMVIHLLCEIVEDAVIA